MLMIGDRLNTFSIAAGEPWIMTVQMRRWSNSAIIDFAQRRMVLSFYGPARALKHQIDGVYVTDQGDPYFAFIRDGSFSEELFTAGDLTVELAERLRNGRAIIASGPLSVVSSSDGVVTFGQTIGLSECRFEVFLNANNTIREISQEIFDFTGDVASLPPIIDTPAGINSDGTPQVGETFTGVDPTGNGPIVARRWIFGGSTVDTDQTYTATGTGALRYEADLRGPDGTTATSGSTITVAAAPPTPISISGTPPTTGQVGTPYSFTPTTANGSGTKVFALAGGTLLAGLSLNTATGAITGTPTASGTMTGLSVRVTDDTRTVATTPTNVTIADTVGVPIKIAVAGSSTPQRAMDQFGDSDGRTPDTRVTASSTGTGFTTLTAGRMGKRLGKALADSTGRPVQFITRGSGGTTLAMWESDSGGHLTGLVNAIKAAGGVDALWLQAGYNDIATGTPASKAAHLALLRSFESKVRSATSLPNLMIFIGISQDKQFKPEMRYVREAEMATVNNDQFVRIFGNQSDLTVGDGVHLTEASYDTYADRAFLQLNAFFQGAAQKRGPKAVSAARVSDTTTDVTFQHYNGTDFTPTANITGFSVYDSAGALISGSVLGARQSATVVRVTHPTGAVSIDFYTNPLSDAAGGSDPDALKDNGTVPLLAEPSEALLSISGAGVSPVTISGDPGPMTSGQAYSFVPTTSGGDGGKTFSISPAPPSGLTFNSSTGSLTAASGNTVAAQTYSFRLSVTSAGTTAFMDRSITIAAAGGNYTATGKRALVDYSTDSDASSPGFNLHRSGNRAGTVALNMPDGTTSTGWSHNVTLNGYNGLSGSSGAITGNDSGRYPDNVLKTYWTANSGTIVVRFIGLDDTKFYDLRVLGNRSGANNRFTNYTCNNQTLNQANDNNTSNVSTFSKVKPTSGVIECIVAQGQLGDGSTSGFWYINAGEIIEYSAS